MGKKTDPFVRLTQRLQKRYGVKSSEHPKLTSLIQQEKQPVGFMDGCRIFYIEPDSGRYEALLSLLNDLDPVDTTIRDGFEKLRKQDTPVVKFMFAVPVLQEILDFAQPSDIISFEFRDQLPAFFMTTEFHGMVAPRVDDDEDDDDWGDDDEDDDVFDDLDEPEKKEAPGDD